MSYQGAFQRMQKFQVFSQLVKVCCKKCKKCFLSLWECVEGWIRQQLCRPPTPSSPGCSSIIYWQFNIYLWVYSIHIFSFYRIFHFAGRNLPSCPATRMPSLFERLLPPTCLSPVLLTKELFLPAPGRLDTWESSRRPPWNTEVADNHADADFPPFLYSF